MAIHASESLKQAVRGSQFRKHVVEADIQRNLDDLGRDYQSLEDRIVKRLFAEATASSTPRNLPFELPGHAPQFASLTRGAERADDAEIQQNPRSAAVRLRAVQRVQPKPEAARKGG